MKRQLLLTLAVLIWATSGHAQVPPRGIQINSNVAVPVTTMVTRQDSADSITLDLEPLRRQSETSGAIRLVREDGTTVTTSEGRAVTLTRGELLTVPRSVETERFQIRDVTVTASPTILYSLDDAGQPRQLSLAHYSSPLNWDPDEQAFKGRLFIGVLDRESLQATGALRPAMTVQLVPLSGTLETNDVETNNVRIETIGLPYEQVDVTVEFPASPFPVSLMSQIDSDIQAENMEVMAPRLLLSATPQSIDGLGVEEAVLTVTAVNTRLTEGEALTLSAENAWIPGPDLIVNDRGTASTRLRSRWLGSGTISFVAPSIYEAEPLTIEYYPPMGFFLAALAGGLMGGFVFAYLQNRGKAEKEQSYVLDGVVGLIIGLGATTMAYAGMTLPEAIPVPPVLVGGVAPFALSFVSATLGTALVDLILGAGRLTAAPE